MTKQQAPFGVILLAVFHIVAGVAGVLVSILGFVLHVRESGAGGLPLGFLLQLGAALTLGVGAGIAMLRGRSWSLYTSTSLYLLVSGFLIVMLYKLRDTLGETGIAKAAAESDLPPSLLFAAPGLIAVGGIAAYAYLFTNAPRAHFTQSDRSRWVPLGIQSAAVVGIAFLILRLFDPGGMLEPSQGNAPRLQALGEMRTRDDENIEFMIKHLASGNLYERITAAWALGESGRQDVVPELLRSVREDADEDVRMNVIVSLGKLGGEGVEPALVEVLSEDNEDLVSAALRGLARVDRTGALEPVGRLLESDSARLRANAVDALGAMRDAAAVPLLAKVAQDPEQDVRTRTAYALGKLRDASAVPTLIALCEDSGWEVRANAVQSLGMIADPAGKATVERLLDDPNSMVRPVAEQALEKF